MCSAERSEKRFILVSELVNKAPLPQSNSTNVMKMYYELLCILKLILTFSDYEKEPCFWQALRRCGQFRKIQFEFTDKEIAVSFVSGKEIAVTFMTGKSRNAKGCRLT